MSIKLSKLEIEPDPELLSGQMVVSGFDGKKAPRELKAALKEGRLSGVILFRRNLEKPAQVRKLTDSIRDACALPPLIAIDQEGGRVQNLPGPFTQWPSMREFGKRADSGKARALAQAVAAELLAAGINTNFAPVLDVDTNPENPVIGDRSLDSDPHAVARLGSAMIEGYTGAGLLSCGKHFPGHGDASVDSHLDLPEVDVDRTTLERRELLPFQEAIAAGVPMIMSAHLKAAALDPYYPATISRKVMYDLLRVEMGFEGVVMTDDLEMGALMKHMPMEDAAYSAARAGCDLLLMCSGPGRAELARKTVVDAIKNGALSMGDVTVSARRVLSLKERFLLDGPPPKEELDKVAGCKEHQDLARVT